ncbi:MAG: hypothetical protein EOP14_01660 [Pseudomonas sp.]|nr:MAG: hypothetical protein EOP14_01660 [Pseudomonas sp.]
MVNNANIKRLVQYRAGDGPLIDISEGPIEIEVAADSAVVSWTDKDELFSAAIPMEYYRRHISECAIEENA